MINQKLEEIMRKRLIISILAVIFVLSCGTSLFSASAPEISQQEEQEIIITSNTFIKIAQEAQKFVVSILVTTRRGTFGIREQGIGSGIIIDEEGYILTNNHVIEKAEKIIVMFDGQRYEALVIGSDLLTDIALIKIEPKKKLTPAPLGDSDKVKIGEWVVAVGSPLGLRFTVTHGIVSAKRQDLGISDGPLSVCLIQTDAPINPGSSGGPLLNLKGEVIGINGIKISQIGIEGIGFAISINAVKAILPALKKYGGVIRNDPEGED